MSTVNNDETGFSESDIHFARQTFIRDCPNGRCSKRRFLTFINKSSLQKPDESKFSLFKGMQNYRRRKKFFSTMFNIYDRNHDGELDFDEYLYALSAISGANRLRTVETLFSFFDVHNQGYITREVFNSRKKIAAQFLGQSKNGVTDHLSYDQAFNAMDTNKDGRISKEEFMQWHLKDHDQGEQAKPTKKRTRLFRNLSTFVELRGHIKTSSLQQREERQQPVNTWLETAEHNNQADELAPTSHADRYLVNILRRARHRIQYSKQSSPDRTSDSGVYTLSSISSLFDNGADIDEDDFPPDDTDNELLCQSLEAVLLEAILELRQHSQRQRANSQLTNQPDDDDDQAPVFTRL